MAGPNDDDHKAAPAKQTGTRPKSRSNTSLGSVAGTGSQSALLSLMREYQAVTDSLALARDQIEREEQRLVTNRVTSSDQPRPEDRLREIESLRSRLMELETVSTEQEAQSSVDHVMDSDIFFTRLR